MKKSLLATLGLICFAGGSFAVPADLGSNSSSTPYDRYLAPVKSVLTHLDGGRPDMNRVRQLMREGHSFRYLFTDPYVACAPEVTGTRRSGDCKDKALWLASQLNDPSIRFVVGKARSSSKISHAWLLWKNESLWYILDCTNLAAPVAVEKVSPKEYIPYYSFARNGTFRHQSTQLLTADRVASKGKMPVASVRD